MLSKLWVAQDLFAELQAVSVLLVLVTSLQKKTEQTLHQASESVSLPLLLTEPCNVHKNDFIACSSGQQKHLLLLQASRASHALNTASSALR